MQEGYLPKQDSLFAELRNWKNTEKLREGGYDEAALKSRSFQKLKLLTFQQLYTKYKGSSLSVDEQALHRMLRYKSNQIEQKLYPNPMLRLGRRAWMGIRRKVEGLIKGSPSQKLFNASRMESVISTAGPENGVDISVVKSKEEQVEQSKQLGGRWVNDLGKKRKSHDKDQKSGASLVGYSNVIQRSISFHLS